MQVASLTEWLNSPETRVLLTHLRHRKAAVEAAFLAGQPVTQVTQGRAAAYHDIVALLTSPPDKVRDFFENVLREQKV